MRGVSCEVIQPFGTYYASSFLIHNAKWIKSYILLTETILISRFSSEREGGWVPDHDIGKTRDEMTCTKGLHEMKN